ncbi:butyrophilin subfamily 3 member A2-like isoform X2 [Thunnus maccoyii]|uniref:butyrophilin subfamily 3 member A2-like isoform X2 n=1 Tax=Thunnus maccoyii TaxID=8240 RepID=UPI001C4A8FB4|nr:butyrophilin subfamily 3 member A2-like isoform X2 [Thunnus maccoyii]
MSSTSIALFDACLKMFHLNDGHFFRDFAALLFHHTVIFLPLIQSSTGELQVNGPSQPIVATVGDDILLPCHLKPAVDASDMAVAWLRPDLDPRFVHVWREGVELVFTKHLSYDGRTSLFVNKLKQGDISLKLSNVKPSDNGTYECHLQGLNIKSFIQLVVGAVSSPVVTKAEMNRSISVVLQCESKGWYPEPEVFWLDGEGNLLSAGPTETVRGPDDLYNVSSRVTVEKSDSFTCRVQQNNINQTREAHIIVPDDFFMVPSKPIIAITISIVVIIIIVTAVFAWKLRPDKQTANGSTDINMLTRENLLAQCQTVKEGPETEEKNQIAIPLLTEDEEQASGNNETGLDENEWNENLQLTQRAELESRNNETEEDELHGYEQHGHVLLPDDNEGCEIQPPAQEEVQESMNNKTEEDGLHEHILLPVENESCEIQLPTQEEDQVDRNNENKVIAEIMRKLDEERRKTKELEDKTKALEDEKKKLKEDLQNVQLELQDERERGDQLEKNLKNIVLQQVERKDDLLNHEDSEHENEEQDSSEEDEDGKNEDSEQDNSESDIPYLENSGF